jgi:hypothetical protein
MRNKLRQLPHISGAVLTGLVAMSLVGVLLSSVPVEAAKMYINFAGSRPGGGWFYMAGGLSPILTREIKSLNVVAESTQGDVENVRRMASGDLDMAIVHAPTMVEAYLGVNSFKGRKPGKDVRVLMKFYDSPFGVFALKSSGIKSFGDLAGKTIAGGPAGSGSIKNFKMALKAFGLLKKVKKIKYLTYADETNAMIDGSLDAAAQNGLHSAWTLSLDAQRPINLVPMSPAQLNLFVKTYPGFWIGTYDPTKVFKTIKKPYPTVWDTVFWMANKRVPEKIAYQIVKTVFTPRIKKILPKIHRLLRGTSHGLEEARKSGLPMHPGALRYWREQGVKVSGK